MDKYAALSEVLQSSVTWLRRHPEFATIPAGALTGAVLYKLIKGNESSLAGTIASGAAGGVVGASPILIRAFENRGNPDVTRTAGGAPTADASLRSVEPPPGWDDSRVGWGVLRADKQMAQLPVQFALRRHYARLKQIRNDVAEMLKENPTQEGLRHRVRVLDEFLERSGELLDRAVLRPGILQPKNAGAIRKWLYSNMSVKDAEDIKTMLEGGLRRGSARRDISLPEQIVRAWPTPITMAVSAIKNPGMGWERLQKARKAGR